MKARIQQLIDIIKRDGGIIDFAEDLDDFIELDKLLDAEESATELASIELLQRPVVVGDLLLYRLSWGAIEWLRECAWVWFENSEYADIAVAYAMANSMNQSAFEGKMCADMKHAKRTLRKFVKNIHATWDSVTRVIDSLLPEQSNGEQQDESQRKSPVEAALLPKLISHFGGSEYTYLFSMSVERLDMYINIMIDLDREQIETITALSGGKAELTPNPDSRSAHAFRAVAVKIKEINSRCLSRKESNE